MLKKFCTLWAQRKRNACNINTGQHKWWPLPYKTIMSHHQLCCTWFDITFHLMELAVCQSRVTGLYRNNHFLLLRWRTGYLPDGLAVVYECETSRRLPVISDASPVWALGGSYCSCHRGLQYWALRWARTGMHLKLRQFFIILALSLAQAKRLPCQMITFAWFLLFSWKGTSEYSGYRRVGDDGR